MTDKQHILANITIIGGILFILALTIPIVVGEIVARRNDPDRKAAK